MLKINKLLTSFLSSKKWSRMLSDTTWCGVKPFLSLESSHTHSCQFTPNSQNILALNQAVDSQVFNWGTQILNRALTEVRPVKGYFQVFSRKWILLVKLQCLFQGTFGTLRKRREKKLADESFLILKKKKKEKAVER